MFEILNGVRVCVCWGGVCVFAHSESPLLSEFERALVFFLERECKVVKKLKKERGAGGRF